MTLNAKYQVHLATTVSNPVTREAELHNISGAVLNETLNDIESFGFELKMGDPLIPTVEMSKTQLIVSRNNTIVWWGIVTGMEGDSTKGTLTYVAQDLSWLFTKRYVAPITRDPYFSTRFQLANTTANGTIPTNYHKAPTSAATVPDIGGVFSTSGTLGFASRLNAADLVDQNWMVSLQVEHGGDIWYEGASVWNARAFSGYWESTFGNVPGTVTQSPPQSPDIYVVNTTAHNVRNDASNVAIKPFPGGGSCLTYINWGTASTIDTANTLTANTRQGGRMWRRWSINNSSPFPKDVHAIAYVRLNTSALNLDYFSSMTQTLRSAQNFSTFDETTWGETPAIRSLAKFGRTNTNYTPAQTDEYPVSNTDWAEVAYVDVDGLPGSQWVRLVMKLTLPANSTNNNLVFQFNAATPPGYIIGGLDLVLEDGLFYENTEQATIVTGLLTAAQSNGWQSLNMDTTVQTSGQLRTKAYYYSDNQTLYDALWEYTTLLGGYDYGWTYSRVANLIRRRFNAYYAPPNPGTAVGTALGKGIIRDEHLVYGDKIAAYQVTADGSQMADVVGVIEPTTDAIDGMARDLATVSSSPVDRWQLGVIYEGTPGNDVLTLQSQAQRGFNRYSKPGYTLNLTLNPNATDTIFGWTVGDVVYVSIPPMGMDKVQFRITGRTTTLDTDTVVLTVQQFHGV